MRKKLWYFAILLILAAAAARPAVIEDASSALTAMVDAAKNLRVAIGPSVRPTYRASATGLTCTAASTLSIEAGASTGFKLARVCVFPGQATASVNPTVVIARRSTASSAGTAATNEGTASPSVSRMDPADGTFPGIVRLNGTPGTAGAIIDSWGVYVGELGTGESGPQDPFCKTYGEMGDKMPTVSPGVANGLSIVLGSPGAGGVGCTISATLIAE